jgi:uncharacterized Zn-binding protein involved in type VI secretion
VAKLIDIIRLGDSTSHGGEVVSASSTMGFNGRAVARRGDEVSCPRHGRNRIIHGDESMTDDGVPIARHGHRSECGCRLISSLI